MTPWDYAQGKLAEQKAAEAKQAQQRSAYEDLVRQIYAAQNGYAPQGSGYQVSDNDPRYTKARILAGESLWQEDQTNPFSRKPSDVMAQGQVPLQGQLSLQRRSSPATVWPTSPMVQALQQYRNPQAQQANPWNQSGKQKPDDMNQWMQTVNTEGSPMEKYLQWRDIYKPNNQGWLDKFQAQRERAAAIKAGALGDWGQLQGQRAGAQAQVSAANVATAAQRYAQDVQAKTALEQMKMQYALAQQGGVKK